MERRVRVIPATVLKIAEHPREAKAFGLRHTAGLVQMMKNRLQATKRRRTTITSISATMKDGD